MISAMASRPGPRIAGAFMANVQTRLVAPASGATNTSSTITVQAVALDPLRRGVTIAFAIDRTAIFGGAAEMLGSSPVGKGWAAVPLSWTSPAAGNGAWWYRARSTLVAVGAGPSIPSGRWATAVTFNQAGGAGVPRSLYLYENYAVHLDPAGVGSNARCLYLYNNAAVRNQMGLDLQPLARDLYLYVNRQYIASVVARCLYLYENKVDGEVFPWLSHLYPTEQYEGGQVSLYGDGFGEYLEVAASATITADSVNSTYVAANAVDRSTGSWVSNSTRANAWIRFTFGATKRIAAIVLEGAGNGWGVPRFRFSDASEVSGGISVPAGQNASPDLPCGTTRQAYWLPTPKDTTYVEIRGPVGDNTSFVGLYEVWILERVVPAENAETSRAWLNLDLLTVKDLGIVSWQNRSPNWYPANGGVPPTPAAVVTIPAGSTSGLVTVQEET